MKAITAAVVSSLASLAPSLALAGPLTPPPGAVAPTGKTIQEAEPRTAINQENTPGDANSIFIINRPGSYYLTRNIISSSGQTAIDVNVDDVTIDLNGFSLLSTNPANTGIRFLTANNPKVRNGTIRGWFNGIDASTADRGIYEDLVLIGNTSSGLNVGDHSVVRDCIAEGNTLDGISADDNSTVSGCTAVGNGRTGIALGLGSTVTGCTATNNGLSGINAGQSSTVTACSARANGANGFSLSITSQIADCVATDNISDGISVNVGSTISGCSAEGNGVHGFDLASGSSITGSTAYNNIENGIDANFDCRVTNNTCDSNSGWGILGASDTTVDSNTVTDNGNSTAATGGGIRCPFGLIIRNTAAGNLVIQIDTVNADFGPLVSQAGEIISTNPWANIVY